MVSDLDEEVSHAITVFLLKPSNFLSIEVAEAADSMLDLTFGLVFIHHLQEVVVSSMNDRLRSLSSL